MRYTLEEMLPLVFTGLNVGITIFIFSFSNSGMLKGGKRCRDERLWQVTSSPQAGSPGLGLWQEIDGSAEREGESSFLTALIWSPFLSHISVCGARGRGRRVRRGGRGWEFPSCFSSGAECEGNNSWSESRHSLGQGMFGDGVQTCGSHRYHCQWLEYLWGIWEP